MKDSLLVLSGGVDSTVMLYKYASKIAMAVNFNYGSNHNKRENDCAALSCKRLGIPMIRIDLDFIAKYFDSSLLDGADAIPEGEYDDENMRSTVVPFRNGIMLAVAAGIAETHKLKTLMLANHSGDHAIYPDCRPGFIDAMSRAIAEGTYDGITIDAPFTNLSKTDIVRIGAEIGVDFANTYSCYRGGVRHCGRCGTCRERREAFRDAGVTDPTHYEND
ncbi:MAG: 7-cyano-7-deazaguanine synthase QueC [Muribaculaceae bacterium]|nr:7-cyano-7-deazaguanine synthase QueC [Muribaculaceae bacterium]MDE5967772.1 7-cyano-7-deazaguanine synthase QueC [Muribaculaceae bacterium]MDE7392987.1 7-cyano-7-deazaguanine synthase QueC [Muribaculaceae bacterium]